MLVRTSRVNLSNSLASNVYSSRRVFLISDDLNNLVNQVSRSRSVLDITQTTDNFLQYMSTIPTNLFFS